MSDLTAKEQANVRTAMLYLKARCGGWAKLVKVLRYKQMTMAHAVAGQPVSAALAFRVARFAGASIDDLLAGNFPPAGTCPYCGHRKEDDTEAAQ